MISIRVDKSRLKSLTRGRLAKLVSGAVSDALNRTAFSARKSIQGSLQGHMQIKKLAFFRRSTLVQKATNIDLTAIVGFHERLIVMPLMIDSRRQKVRLPFDGRSIAVPQKALGRVTRSKLPKALLAKRTARIRYFIATIEGTRGIWKSTKTRRTSKIELMYALVDKTVYQRSHFPLHKIVSKVASRRFPRYMTESLHKAIDRSSR